MTLHKRRIASMALAIALLLMSPLPVFAGSASGSNATASSGSKSFVTYSNIYTSSSFADASQAIRSAQTTSAGEMGANPRLFTANGALYRDGGWQYSWSTLGGYNWLFSTHAPTLFPPEPAGTRRAREHTGTGEATLRFPAAVHPRKPSDSKRTI